MDDGANKGSASKGGADKGKAAGDRRGQARLDLESGNIDVGSGHGVIEDSSTKASIKVFGIGGGLSLIHI